MHGHEGDVHKATQMADPLSGMWRGTHSGIDEGAPMAHAWEGYGDRLEPVTGQSDGAHTTCI